MGRTKAKRLARAAKYAPAPPEPDHDAPPISALLEKAQTLIVQCDYALAHKFTARILERDPTNTEAQEMLGVILVEIGELDSAKQTFLSIASGPNPPPSAHLYLAQLSDDDPRQALQHYQAAIDILITQLKGKVKAQADTAENAEDEVRENIVRAYVGSVEIWMDPAYDLCFEEDADVNCERLLEQALQISPGNSEALQSLANVRLSQQRPDDARKCLEESWISWKDLDIDDLRVPPIPTRLSLVRLFLELELYSPALLVLQGILSTDDQEVEAWYLEGWCCFLMAEKAKETGEKIDDLAWEELASDARSHLEKCQRLHVQEEHPDVPLLDHARELIKQLEALGIHYVPEDEDDGDGWEDVGSEGEDDDVDMS
ncbi:TPR-like protein [Cylindrobasidium torrendii FP15055 ss-10]|uniref:TPR-like protein n=1 Tax=Cylindrobasidium torrendii FP15055 ss-10 TaxID=1314674 RepID=A0A0D7BLZ6_9AGAR|nr:TPR-like protein [Cylindrobasidium torrendii FP15055 ss-10]